MGKHTNTSLGRGARSDVTVRAREEALRLAVRSIQSVDREGREFTTLQVEQIELALIWRSAPI